MPAPRNGICLGLLDRLQAPPWSRSVHFNVGIHIAHSHRGISVVNRLPPKPCFYFRCGRHYKEKRRKGEKEKRRKGEKEKRRKGEKKKYQRSKPYCSQESECTDAYHLDYSWFA
jgi:hypothetical protein